LKVASALDKLGYAPLGPFGNDSLLFQKLHAGWQDANYMLIDPAWKYGFQIEVQCNFTEDVIVQMAADCEFEKAKKKEDKKAFYAWELPVKGTKSTSWTLTELRKKRIQIAIPSYENNFVGKQLHAL